MYKMVLMNEIRPGKLADFQAWAAKADERRKADNPDYEPPNRYGNVTQPQFLVRA